MPPIRFHRYLSLSGSAGLAIQLPVDVVLRCFTLSMSSSVAATAPGVAVAQIKHGPAGLVASGDNSVIGTMEHSYQTAQMHEATVMTVYPDIVIARGEFISLNTQSPTDGSCYADLVLFFEPLR